MSNYHHAGRFVRPLPLLAAGRGREDATRAAHIAAGVAGVLLAGRAALSRRKRGANNGLRDWLL